MMYLAEAQDRYRKPRRLSEKQREGERERMRKINSEQRLL